MTSPWKRHRRKIPMMQERICRSEAGLTLVELAITSGIVLVGLLMLIGAVIAMSRQSVVSDLNVAAASFSQSTFEDLRGRSLAQIQEYTLPFPVNEDGTITIVGLGDARVMLRVVLPDDSLFTIGVDDPGSVSTWPKPLEVQLDLAVSGGIVAGFRDRFSSLVSY